MIRGAVKTLLAVAGALSLVLGMGAASVAERGDFECHRVPIVGNVSDGTVVWGYACGDPYVFHPAALTTYAGAHGGTPDFPVCYDCMQPPTESYAQAHAQLWDR